MATAQLVLGMVAALLFLRGPAAFTLMAGSYTQTLYVTGLLLFTAALNLAAWWALNHGGFKQP